MGQNDPEKKNAPPAPDNGEPGSGPRAKGSSDDLQLLMAQLKQRAQGLDGEDLEDEIRRFLDKMIERNVKIAPENLREEGRRILRSVIEGDPTMQEMIADLRNGLKKI